jgi:two-component system, NtrC family, response regulator HydG
MGNDGLVKVLVVDDDIAFCRVLHHMIANEQYKVQTSHSVADALEAMEQTPFEIYVMDYKLPNGGGIDIAQQIRSQGSAAPIILISGYDPSALASRTQQLHISDFLQKPFSREEMCHAVERRLLLYQITGRLSHPNPNNPKPNRPYCRLRFEQSSGTAVSKAQLRKLRTPQALKRAGVVFCRST